jgi:K+-sensing histidine kinase KdpD
MKNNQAAVNELNQAEARLLTQLREHPEMMERVQNILDLTRSAEGPLKTADEVEELLVQELRRLGNTSMNQWALGAEERVTHELTGQDPTVRSRKKKR